MDSANVELLVRLAQLFGAILLAAVLIEASVNALDVFKGFALSREWFAANWQYLVALVFGLVAAVTYNLDFFAAIGLEGSIPYVGTVFTGIIISRGSNFVNDLIEKLRSWKSTTVSVVHAPPPAPVSVTTTTTVPREGEGQ